jgi:hypothetical protein
MEHSMEYVVNLKRDEDLDVWFANCERLPDYTLEVEVMDAVAERVEFSVMDHLEKKGLSTDVKVKVNIEVIEADPGRKWRL